MGIMFECIVWTVRPHVQPFPRRGLVAASVLESRIAHRKVAIATMKKGATTMRHARRQNRRQCLLQVTWGQRLAVEPVAARASAPRNLITAMIPRTRTTI